MITYLAQLNRVLHHERDRHGFAETETIELTTIESRSLEDHEASIRDLHEEMILCIETASNMDRKVRYQIVISIEDN